MSGTAIDRLGELNEVGCIDKDNRDMKGKELGCVSTKGKLLMQAIDVRQMITFAELCEYYQIRYEADMQLTQSCQSISSKSDKI